MSATNFLSEAKNARQAQRIKEWVLQTIVDADSGIDSHLTTPVPMDVTKSTNTIVKTYEDAVVTMTLTYNSSTSTYTGTENIVMNEGDYDYIRTTTVSTVNGVRQYRTTLQKVAKNS